ncbi:MAG: T9SS type A sorting domain-containing protein [Bacteroidetes bacterium]|nr:T9SS type A sorting domain-containing protein [Bacteroidota bacterium]
MNRIVQITTGSLLLLSIGLWSHHPDAPTSASQSDSNPAFKKLQPNLADAWKWSYPEDHWDVQEATLALNNVRRWSDDLSSGPDRMTGGEWRLEGPTNIGGRFNFIRQHPTETNRFFAGASAGGLWTDPGDGEWVTLTDDIPHFAMGDLAFHPLNEDRLFLATGDPQISSFPRIGGGVYRSLNGGSTWENVGLDTLGVISRLLILPDSPNTIFAACMGNPAIPGPARGLFRSNENGQNWEQVLLPHDSAGVTDLAYAPDSQTLLASAWQRTRTSTNSIVAGAHCKIWKSVDGGSEWLAIDNPWGEGSRGRIGLAELQGIFWALVVGTNHQLDNIYRSDDGGTSWSAIIPEGAAAENALGGFGWYFSKIRINPWNADDITILGVECWNSLNGGVTWQRLGPEWWTYEVHADKHDLQWVGPQSLILATDGGLYRSDDHGLTWEDLENIPVTQFYRATWNPHNPGQYTAGAQDNGTTTGSQEDLNAWTRDLGGDGFTAIYHPTNANLRYAGTQWGNWRYSMTGPDEEPQWNNFMEGIDEEDRVWWDAPLAYHPANPDEMWTGTQRVYRMSNAPFSSWQAVSPDLTHNEEPGLQYRCITVVAGSPFNEDLVAAGTSDGRVWVSTDHGDNWDSMEIGLPGQFVTDLVFDPFHPDSMFCTVSGFRNAVYTPYVYRAAIGGNWTSAQGDLPPHPINHVEALNDSIWVVATDAGIHWTETRGQHWEPVGSHPLIPVYDLAVDTIADRLVAGTFARSLWTFPLDSLLPAAVMDTVQNAVSTLVRFENQAFPNPFHDALELRSDAGTKRIVVYDASGQILFDLKPEQRMHVSTSAWSNGTYIIQWTHANGQTNTEVILKQ